MKKYPQLISIPRENFSEYRYDAIFKAYKWDPQVEDDGTVSRHVVLMDTETAAQLETWAEQLTAETVAMEEALAKQPELAKELCLPRKLSKTLGRLADYDPGEHVRLMRFDFHPTVDGWAVSEVNSDVPGGFAEASALSVLAARYFDGCRPRKDVAGCLIEAFKPKMKGGPLAFVYATSYSDDRQAIQFLSDRFNAAGINTFFAGPDHLKWKDRMAVSIMEGNVGTLDGILRFFPLEWLANLPWHVDWKGYYDTRTPSCNHPVSIFAQSKRLPLVWDKLDVDIPAWKKLLPETKDPRKIKAESGEWIYKPALGRVGEGISIKEAIPEKEMRKIEKAAHRTPGNWVAQRRFQSSPLVTTENETYHLCVGVFTVEGKSAGFYGRISPYPRMDAKARDIPILVTDGGKENV